MLLLIAGISNTPDVIFDMGSWGGAKIIPLIGNNGKLMVKRDNYSNFEKHRNLQMANIDSLNLNTPW